MSDERKGDVMTKKTGAALLAALMGFAVLAARSSADKKLCDGFLPENTLKVPLGPVHADGIAEARFNRVLDRAEEVYGPIFKAKGANLIVERKWEDETVNAYASQSGKNYKIAMFGGLARHPAVTEEGFALVACHEIGHHIGGFPKSSWATNEGGSDYFATLKCLRLVLPIKATAVDPVAAAACAEARPTEIDDCQRSAMAGHSISSLFKALRPGTPDLSFATPDPSVVTRTNNAHPAAQCRLDTYFQGALCGRSVADDVSATDPTVGACTKKGGQAVGLRPRCWYKPPADEPTLDEEAPPAMATRPDSANPEQLKSSLEAMAEILGGRGI